jgi:hypothetical protein
VEGVNLPCNPLMASPVTVTDTSDFSLEVKRSNKNSINNNVVQHFFSFFHSTAASCDFTGNAMKTARA